MNQLYVIIIIIAIIIEIWIWIPCTFNISPTGETREYSFLLKWKDDDDLYCDAIASLIEILYRFHSLYKNEI